ncbi:TPA: transcription-repair coupling factor, partial [Streptococcus agalactiae]
KTQRVMVPGEFSQRGDIVDIYPLDAAQPLRLEFFGDEVDTIRAFDSETQRSHENMDQVEIYPASDFILMPWEFEQGVKKLSAQLQNVTDPTAQSYFEEVIAAAENHYYHKDLRKFAEYFYEKPASLLNYFPK